MYRGQKQGLVNGVDDLVLQKTDGRYQDRGTFVTELFTLPPNAYFDRLKYVTDTPLGTTLAVNILDRSGNVIIQGVKDNDQLYLDEPVQLEFVFTTTDGAASPILDEYSLSFRRKEKASDLKHHRSSP